MAAEGPASLQSDEPEQWPSNDQEPHGEQGAPSPKKPIGQQLKEAAEVAKNVTVRLLKGIQEGVTVKEPRPQEDGIILESHTLETGISKLQNNLGGGNSLQQSTLLTTSYDHQRRESAGYMSEFKECASSSSSGSAPRRL